MKVIFQLAIRRISDIFDTASALYQRCSENRAVPLSERVEITMLNEDYGQYLRDNGADLVCFVDISSLPDNVTEEYQCAVLFAKALSKNFVNTLKAGQKPKPNEVLTVEHKMENKSFTLVDKF